jgi:hypothetical protein
MRITEDLRHIRKVDNLFRFLLEYKGYNRNTLKEGVFLINPKILREIEGFYHYDEQRHPPHKDHIEYKKNYSYFREGPYLAHYLTTGVDKNFDVILQHLPEYEEPVLLIRNKQMRISYGKSN